MGIGVVTDRFARCPGTCLTWAEPNRGWEGPMTGSSCTWCFAEDRNFYHGMEFWLPPGAPKLNPGSKLRVTLDDHRVTFLFKAQGCWTDSDEWLLTGTRRAWTEVYAFTLPEQCGNVSFAVTVFRGAKV